MGGQHTIGTGFGSTGGTLAMPVESRERGGAALGSRPDEHPDRDPQRDVVGEEGEGSFPSSDPPSWSRAVASWGSAPRQEAGDDR